MMLLTALTSLLAAAQTPETPRPIGWWGFEEERGDVVIDQSGGSADGRRTAAKGLY